MNAIETLYLNSVLVTEDGYVKVRDGLWMASGIYKRQSWNDADKSILPTKEELHEIYLKLQELIQIQKACGLPSLKQVLKDAYPWIWSLTEYDYTNAWMCNIRNGDNLNYYKDNCDWVVPVRRTP